MANSYTQINMHVVFSVKGRENIITNSFRNELHKYLYGILKHNEQFPLAINGYKDHVHLFFELNPTTSISQIVNVLKSNSSKWINENSFVKGRFEWQSGYGAFSYAKSQREVVSRYIMNQEIHHKKNTFREEYLALLNRFEIKYNSKYIFDFYE